MQKINKHIEIVRSSVKELSSMSKLSCDALYEVLSRNFERVGVSTVNSLGDLEKLVSLNPDLAFMGMQSIPSVDGADLINSPKIWLSKYLDEKGILCTGSEMSAHKLGSNKALAKKRILGAGLNTSAFFVAKQNMSISKECEFMSYPMFVKPLDRGGGLGVDSLSVVRNHKQLVSKIHSIASKFGSDSIVEEYLDGREFSIAILHDDPTDENIAMPIELIAPEDEFGSRLLSMQVKTEDTETFARVIDLDLKNRLSVLAKDIFTALGARDYGRIDIRLDASGAPQFLEANLIPSIIEGFGNFPKACLLNNELSYESMILRIVDLAFKRESPVDVDLPSVRSASVMLAI